MKDFEYKKSLGQNFLIDQNIIKKIINSVSLENSSLIIEIGPGSGALTKELGKLNSDIICFEIDKRLKEELEKIKTSNIEIIFEDFLKVNLKEFLSKKSFKHLYFIGNLPYYITTPIINKIYQETECDEMILMTQKEVAERFMAMPNSREYGSLSVFLQYNYDISKLVNVSKNCFYPKPKIDSVVIKLKTKRKKEKVKNIDCFYKLIKDSFKFKRKNLRNNLKNYDLAKIEKILNQYGKNLTYRAENLTVSDFVNISNELN